MFSASDTMRTPAFWLLIASINLATLSLFDVNLHLLSYIDDKDIPIGVAAGAVAYLYILQSAVKPTWGFAVERLHVRYCLTVCYAGGVLGNSVLVGTSSMTGLLVFATTYGMTRGAQSFVSSMAWSNYFGREAQGDIRGRLFPFRFISHATGPVFAGLMFDLQGDYTITFSAFVAVFALGSLVALMTRPPRLVVTAQPV